MWAAIWALIQAVSAWLQYTFSPEMVKRRDEINKAASLDKGLEEIDQIFADKNTLKLSFFISEFLRRQKSADSAPGWITDLLDRKLPKPRDAETKAKDDEEGVDLG